MVYPTPAINGRSEQRESRAGGLRSLAHSRCCGIPPRARVTARAPPAKMLPSVPWPAGYQQSPTTRPVIELVNCETGAHVCRCANWIGREPGLPGTRDIGSVVVEIQNLVRRETQAGGQTVERLRVRLGPAEFGGKDRARAEDLRDGGKHLCNVPLSSNGLLVNIPTG